MNKLTRKINQSRIAILRKQLKKINRMESSARLGWNEAYDEEKNLYFSKYTAASLKILRQEYSLLRDAGYLQYRDSVTMMRDLLGRGDKWLLKAFNKVFYGYENGYRHDMVIIDVWKWDDRDSLVKVMHPAISQIDMTRQTLSYHKRQTRSGKGEPVTVVIEYCGDFIHDTNADASRYSAKMSAPEVEFAYLNDEVKVLAVDLMQSRGDSASKTLEQIRQDEFRRQGDAHISLMKGMKTTGVFEGNGVIPSIGLAPAANLGGERGYKPFPGLGDGDDGVIMIAHGEIPTPSLEDLKLSSFAHHNHALDGKIIAQGSFDRLAHQESPSVNQDLDLRDFVIVDLDGTITGIDPEDPNPEATIREALRQHLAVRHKDYYTAKKGVIVNITNDKKEGSVTSNPNGRTELDLSSMLEDRQRRLSIDAAMGSDEQEGEDKPLREVPTGEYAARRAQLQAMGVNIDVDMSPEAIASRHPLNFGSNTWAPNTVAVPQLTNSNGAPLAPSEELPAQQENARPLLPAIGLFVVIDKHGSPVELSVKKSFLMRKSDMRSTLSDKVSAIIAACNGIDSGNLALKVMNLADEGKASVDVKNVMDGALLLQDFIRDAYVEVHAPMPEELREQLYQAGFVNIMPNKESK